MLEAKLEVGSNGKPMLKMRKSVTGQSIERGKGVTFQYKTENLFLIEKKVNSPNLNIERCFTISIRKDGSGRNEGEHVLSQMNLNLNELKLLMDSINEIINYETK